MIILTKENLEATLNLYYPVTKNFEIFFNRKIFKHGNYQAIIRKYLQQTICKTVKSAGDLQSSEICIKLRLFLLHEMQHLPYTRMTWNHRWLQVVFFDGKAMQHRWSGLLVILLARFEKRKMYFFSNANSVGQLTLYEDALPLMEWVLWPTKRHIKKFLKTTYCQMQLIWPEKNGFSYRITSYFLRVGL